MPNRIVITRSGERFVVNERGQAIRKLEDEHPLEVNFDTNITNFLSAPDTTGREEISAEAAGDLIGIPSPANIIEQAQRDLGFGVQQEQPKQKPQPRRRSSNRVTLKRKAPTGMNKRMARLRSLRK